VNQVFADAEALASGVAQWLCTLTSESRGRFAISSAHVAFLATGAAKANIVARVQSQDRALPAARVQPRGRLHWFIDSAVAADITAR